MPNTGFLKVTMVALVLMLSRFASAGIEECIRKVHGEYPYPSIEESAKLCQGGASAECITYLHGEYPYPSISRSAELCSGGVTVGCLRYVHGEYPYPSLEESAKSCRLRCEP